MKRQFKAAALVSTAALLAIGASFTSMAAAKAKTGTWVLEADGWYCYDKNGEAYTDEWCLSYGKEYYVDSNGLLATYSWVEDDDHHYFVGSTGAKTVNDWRYITACDDEDGEESWFYFDAKGKMATGKKVIGGKTYYFDQDGRMLTGWVEYDSENKTAEEADVYNTSVTYCDETGARVKGDWVKTFEPGVDEDEEEDYEQYWYYIQADGDIQTSKATAINGKTYLFDDEGRMLTGWVATFNKTATTESYESFVDDDDVMSNSNANLDTAFYFCDEEDGYVKKDRWIKTWAPADYADEDEDIAKGWYWVKKTGEVYVPDERDIVYDEAYALTFVDGDDDEYDRGADNYKLAINKVNGKEYAFRANGRMWTGLVQVSESGSNAEDYYRYYFGGSDDGRMATGATSIADEDGVSYKFYFGDKDTNGYKKGVAVNGAANKYLYQDGKLVKLADAKYGTRGIYDPITGSYAAFVINANGAIQTTSKNYKNGDEVEVYAEDFKYSDGKFDMDADEKEETIIGQFKGSFYNEYAEFDVK